jgi:hypothetical protein
MLRKAGRPKVPKSKAFQPGFSLRVRPEEFKIIRDAIARSSLTQSNWLRDALLEKARGSKSQSEIPEGADSKLRG